MEESSNAGRLDMVVRFGDRALIFEFKLVDDEATPGGNSTLAAIEERGYAERHRFSSAPGRRCGPGLKTSDPDSGNPRIPSP